MMEKVAIMGASRGLGRELVNVALGAGAEVIAFSRRRSEDFPPEVRFFAGDFAREEGQVEILERIQAEPALTRVFVLAGGGPYGDYGAHQWKDHLWAWQVSFLFPARVVHALMAGRRDVQIVLCGSSVAEQAGDPGAASYASAKHALRGLHASLRLEAPEFDVRLFSPGYMDTELLPKNAPARTLGVWSPIRVAAELWSWALGPDNGGHRVYPRHPS
jgi:NAD(P)-dependent dehydrogenase (short-subunit alcohol dehydrogenase family)